MGDPSSEGSPCPPLGSRADSLPIPRRAALPKLLAWGIFQAGAVSVRLWAVEHIACLSSKVGRLSGALGADTGDAPGRGQSSCPSRSPGQELILKVGSKHCMACLECHLPAASTKPRQQREHPPEPPASIEVMSTVDPGGRRCACHNELSA